jgi:CubicO group peptidase (beta-lactamase class C family)
MADIGAKRAMTADTYFYVYSMTKPVTSVALLMLYEEGKFQLNEPIARYLPELANARVFDRSPERGITGPLARRSIARGSFPTSSC